MSQLPPQQGIVSDPSLLYGMAPTTQAQQFITEEQEAAAARGQSSTQLWAGFKLPPGDAGDFWQVYSMAETFAANTGWKYLPTPQMILQLIKGGNYDPQAVFSWMAVRMKIPPTMPWASLGMSSTQYKQATSNLGDSLYSLTGQSSFSAAGISNSVVQNALFNGWTAQHLQNYIQQNPSLNAKYGYLQYGQNYQQFQNYKIQNADALRSRFGHQFTDAQAIQQLAAPTTAFHAQGGAFGESVPYVSSQSTMLTGRQSAVR